MSVLLYILKKMSLNSQVHLAIVNGFPLVHFLIMVASAFLTYKENVLRFV